MNSLILVAVLLVLSAIGYQIGRKRALAGTGGQIKGLHSLPSYYGAYVALWCALPALLVIAVWLSSQSSIVDSLVISGLPASVQALSEDRLVAEALEGAQDDALLLVCDVTKVDHE